MAWFCLCAGSCQKCDIYRQESVKSMEGWAPLLKPLLRDNLEYFIQVRTKKLLSNQCYKMLMFNFRQKWQRNLIVLVSFKLRLASASENEYYTTINGGKYYHSVHFKEEKHRKNTNLSHLIISYSVCPHKQQLQSYHLISFVFLGVLSYCYLGNVVFDDASSHTR